MPVNSPSIVLRVYLRTGLLMSSPTRTSMAISYVTAWLFLGPDGLEFFNGREAVHDGIHSQLTVGLVSHAHVRNQGACRLCLLGKVAVRG